MFQINKNIIIILIFIFLISLLFSFFSIKKLNKFRQLNEEENTKENNILIEEHLKLNLKELCEVSSEDLFNYYYYNGTYEFNKNLTISNTEYTNIIIKFIEDKNYFYLSIKYFKHIYKWVILIFICITLYIIWITFLILYIFKCYDHFGKFEIKCKSIFYIKIFLIISFILNLCICGICIYGLIYIDKVMKGLNGSSCSLLQFVQEFKNGLANKNLLPYWAGLNNFPVLLDNIILDIRKIIDNYSEDFYTKKNKFNELLNNWDNLINISENSAFSSFDPKTYYNIKINESLNVVPDIILKWGPVKDSKSYLYLFNLEYQIISFMSKTLLDFFEEKLTELTDCFFNNETSNVSCPSSNEFSKVQENIFKAKSKLVEIIEPVNVIEKKISIPWYNIQNKVNVYGKIILKCIFSLMSIFSILIIIFVFFYISNLKKKLLIKSIFHTIWNIIIFLSLITIIIGNIFGIIGTVGYDLVDVMVFLLSEENIQNEEPKIFNKIDHPEYLSTCMYGNGDLGDIIGLKNKTSSIQMMLDIVKNITDVKDNSSSLIYSPVGKLIEDKIVHSLENDIYVFDSGTKVLDIYNISSIIYELNRYTFLGKDTYQILNETCVKVDEYWWINTSYMSYIFPLNENVSFYPNFKENSKLLMYLYLEDLDKITNYSQRYSNINNLCSIDESAKYDNIQEAVNVYVKILENVRNNFVSDEFKNAFDDLKNNINNIYYLVSDLLNISLKVINQLSSSIIDYIGKYGKIWDLLNCNFVGINIKIILNQLHFGVGKNLIKIGIIFICLSFIQIINIIIILITTRIYKQNIKKNKMKNSKEKNEKDSYINNSNDSIEIKKE